MKIKLPPDQLVAKVLSAPNLSPKFLNKLFGFFILFRSVEDSKIEASKVAISKVCDISYFPENMKFF